jgi:hydrogenase maturation protease
MSPRALVLGLGNPLCGDDAFGEAVVAALERSPLAAPARVELARAGTDLLGELGRLAAHDLVILVDALLDDAAAERGVRVLEEEELAAWGDASPSVHELSPLLALRLFRALEPGAATRVVLVALRTPKIALGQTGPAPEWQKLVEEGVCAVRGLLALSA